MTVRVMLLRRGGARLPDTRSDKDWVEGHVSMSSVGGGPGPNYRQVQLRAVGAFPVDPPLLQLYEPALINLGGDRLLLRGFEVVGKSAMVQEWLVDLDQKRREPASF